MEHNFDWINDLLQRSSHPHWLNARPAGKIIKQNPNKNKNRSKLQNAHSFPTSCILYTKVIRWFGYVINGSHFNSSSWFKILKTNWTRNYTLQSWYVTLRGSINSKSLSVYSNMGLVIYWQSKSMGWVCYQKTIS